MLLALSVLQNVYVELGLRRRRVHQIAVVRRVRGVRSVRGVPVVGIQQGGRPLPHHAHHPGRGQRVVSPRRDRRAPDVGRVLRRLCDERLVKRWHETRRTASLLYQCY